MAENSKVPWLLGLCLQGELAGQYVLDPQAPEQEPGRKVAPAAAGDTQPPELVLDDLAPITIFVGANNSGKSRLMRGLFCERTFPRFKLGATVGQSERRELASEIRRICNIIAANSVVSGFSGGWLMPSQRNPSAREDVGHINAILGTIESEMLRVRQGVRGAVASRYRSGSERLDELLACQQSMSDLGLTAGIREAGTIKRCYVPMLRGMRPPYSPAMRDQSAANPGQDDLYKERTVHDYFDKKMPKGASGSGYEIFTGLSLYTDLRRRLLGRTQQERDTVREYEAYLSDNFFPGRPVTLVPVEDGDNDVVHIKIGDEDGYPIHQLGDGMQSLIVCSYPILMESDEGCLFFLEEPDIGMHPSLQRSFVQALIQSHRQKHHQFFLTTHSNHLLDLLEDQQLVSIFSFSEIESANRNAPSSSASKSTSSAATTPRFRIRSTPQRDRTALLELGVRPSATYLANATIWVEGISDAAYLRAYMEAFVAYLATVGDADHKELAMRLSQYKEDRHYAFVEYNGANLTHFGFAGDASLNVNATAENVLSPTTTTRAQFLCGHALVIADGDIENKAERIANLGKALGDRFILLPGKEIENLIPEEMVRAQLRQEAVNTSTATGTPGDADTHKTSSDAIRYCDYARKGDHGSFVGLGEYLSRVGSSGHLKASGVPGSGTLTPYKKKKWSSQNGIPARISEARLAIEEAPEPRTAPGSSPDLPGYLTQDILWLCILIYAHVATENHDRDAAGILRRLKIFIRDVMQCPDEPWPIRVPPPPAIEAPISVVSPVNSAYLDQLPSPRTCLLSLFIDHRQNVRPVQSNDDEATNSYPAPDTSSAQAAPQAVAAGDQPISH
ncbi:MAG: AAA family ATPase [Cyanobium sp.]